MFQFKLSPGKWIAVHNSPYRRHQAEQAHRLRPPETLQGFAEKREGTGHTEKDQSRIEQQYHSGNTPYTLSCSRPCGEGTLDPSEPGRGLYRSQVGKAGDEDSSSGGHENLPERSGKARRSGNVLSGIGHGNPQRRADSSALV